MILNYFQIFISIFSILNPVLSASIYIDVTDGLKHKDKRTVALVCATTIFVVLSGFLFIGQPLLASLDIHNYSLQLAGGLIVLIIGIMMILKPNDKLEEGRSEKDSYNKERIKTLGISPLAMPMIVGPASIVLVMLYGAQEHIIWQKLAIVLVLLLDSLSVLAILFLANYIAKAIGSIGIIILTKIMGLIIAAIAVEMIVSGLRAVIPILVQAAS